MPVHNRWHNSFQYASHALGIGGIREEYLDVSSVRTLEQLLQDEVDILLVVRL